MTLRKIKPYLYGIILIIMFGSLLPACTESAKDKTSAEVESAKDKTSAEDVRQETQQLLQALKSYTFQQKDEAIKKTKTALEKLDGRIDEIETRIDNNWDSMTKLTRDKARSTLKSLRKQRVELAEWYGSLKNETGNAWDDTKQGFSNAYSSLYEAWEKAENEFNSDKQSRK